MKKKNIIMSALFLGLVLFSCTKPEEDRTDINGIVDKSNLSYTFEQLNASSRQVQDGGNTLVLSLKSSATVLWRVYRASNKVLITSGTRSQDTLDLPFQGEYLVRVYAAFHNGAVIDSFTVTTSASNPNTFKNPYWALLTNQAAGKYWVLKAKYVGPESNYLTNWWQPDISANAWANDSVYFDLNFGYNYKHYSAGKVTSSTFTMTQDAFSTAPNVIGFGSADVSMADNDAGEMSTANANRFRIFKCTQDTLIVGQGASLTASRTSEDWSWYWVYVRSDLAKKK